MLLVKINLLIFIAHNLISCISFSVGAQIYFVLFILTQNLILINLPMFLDHISVSNNWKLSLLDKKIKKLKDSNPIHWK